MKQNNKKPTPVSFWMNEKPTSMKRTTSVKVSNTRVNKVAYIGSIRDRVNFINPVKTKNNKYPQVNFMGKPSMGAGKKNMKNIGVSFVPAKQHGIKDKKAHPYMSSTFAPKFIDTKRVANFSPRTIQSQYTPLHLHAPKPTQSFFNIPKEAGHLHHPIPKKQMNWIQAQSAYPKLSPWGDADYDGVINMLDCKPFDKDKQDLTDTDWRRIKMNIEQLYREKNADIRTFDMEAERDNSLNYEEANREMMIKARKALGTSAGEKASQLGRGNKYNPYQVKTPEGLLNRGEITPDEYNTLKVTDKSENNPGDIPNNLISNLINRPAPTDKRVEEVLRTSPLSRDALDLVITDVKKFVKDEYAGIINPNKIPFDEYMKDVKTLAEADEAAKKAVDDYVQDLENKAKDFRAGKALKTITRPEGVTPLKDLTPQIIEEAEKKGIGRPRIAEKTPEQIEREYPDLNRLGEKVRNKNASEYSIIPYGEIISKKYNQIENERNKFIGKIGEAKADLKYTIKLQAKAGKTPFILERIREKTEDIANLQSTVSNYTKALREKRAMSKPLSSKKVGRPKMEIHGKSKEPKIKLKVSPFGGITFTGRKEAPAWILKEALVSPNELREITKATKTPEERASMIRGVELNRLRRYINKKVPEYKERIDMNRMRINDTRLILSERKRNLERDVSEKKISREEANRILRNAEEVVERRIKEFQEKILTEEDAIKELNEAPVNLPTNIRRTYEEPIKAKLTAREINAMEEADERDAELMRRSLINLKQQSDAPYENMLSPEFRNENLGKLKPQKVKFVNRQLAPGAEARADIRGLALSVPEYAKKTTRSQLDTGIKYARPKREPTIEVTPKKLTFVETVKDTLKKFKPHRGEGGIIKEMPSVTLTTDLEGAYRKKINEKEREKEKAFEEEISEGAEAQDIIEDLPRFEEEEKYRGEYMQDKGKERKKRVESSGEAYTAAEIEKETPKGFIENLKKENEGKYAEGRGLGITTKETMKEAKENSMDAQSLIDEVSKEE